MTKIAYLLAALLAACGDAGCKIEDTQTRITDTTGTYWLRCSEFQCPGYAAERTCKRM